MYCVEKIISTKSPKEDLGDEIKGRWDYFSSNAKHDTNGSNCSSKSGVCWNSSIKGGTIESTMSHKYLKIRGDKSNIQNKMSIKVVTDANETSKIVGLKVDSTVHIVAIVVVYVGKTMAASSNIGTILGSMFAYLVNYQVSIMLIL